MDANIRLSEEVVRKTKSFERLKVETEKCLAWSESFSNEKTEFESAIYAKVFSSFLFCHGNKEYIQAKFLSVLNSKKGKLRALWEQLVKAGGNGGKSPEEDEESTEKINPFDEGSDRKLLWSFLIILPLTSQVNFTFGWMLAKLITGKDEGSTAAAIGLLLYLQTLRDEQGRDFKRFSETEGIVVNTFLELESHAVSSIARDRNSEMYTVGPILDLKGDARIRSCCAQLHEELIAWFTNPYHQSCSPHGQLRGGPEREPGLWSEAGTGFCGPYTSHRPRERERWSTLVAALVHPAVGGFCRPKGGTPYWRVSGSGFQLLRGPCTQSNSSMGSKCTQRARGWNRDKAIEVLMETKTGEELRKKVKEMKKCRVAIKVRPIVH
ncbi:hypothetical protein CRG98_021022 [Punica granatum]|uniref:Uncharacterized protein n=1 Tax=Punica granatum TaxID=22663 RepID=A0A2I0JQI5_PUNGR|nr:hypothetical protein CRG98_021022 [Punica granatum]